ncbi:G patch domain-containing protein 1 homolog [Leguminivora glycinivorella]|uniref:G patch domain-containing protein 1 homolog n=1 Tax=Leguminivora glycinivorella TaxID=1035111 RepID=UPI00200D38BB|nr:G patch domain-containing protein 1 homolog [Leguminivora glycinivorella]
MSSSDSDEENVIRYGTPLEPYEEDEIPSKRKYQQPPDQFAVDEHGRRRFHGAFTGGFSAGFGNTVGSAEGWTPATFKSSRSDKAQLSRQRPEDFMDDEDRGEHGIAPRLMETQSEFTGRKRQHTRYHDGPIPGEPVLEQLVRAVHETAAVRMLRAMGWRPGQGTGERLSRRQKNIAKEQHKVYGCYMPEELRPTTDPQSDSSDSEFEYDTLFAPDDYEPYVLAQKSDRFGLGYSGLSRHSVLGSMAGEYGQAGSSSHLVMRDKGKKVSIRGQAFGVGALEADDEDIYATEDMSHYDFSLGGPTEQKQKPKGKQESNDGLGRHDLSAEARGSLLGETPIPKTNTLENTKLSQKPDPIAQLLGRNVNFVTDSTNTIETDNKTTDKKPEDFISIKDSGKEIQKVFKPFVSDPAKQARYEKYLKNKDSVLEIGETDRLTAWERNREISEFEQAAKLYKPLSGVMGDRFTHASEPDDAVNPLTAVARSATNYGLATPEQIEAARIGAYGVITRRETIWRPEAIVCKRFNVADTLARPESKKEDKPKVSYSIFNYLESSVHDKESFAKEQHTFSGSKSLNREENRREVVKDRNNEKVTEKVADKINTDPKPSTSTDNSFKRLTVAELFLKESEKDLKSKENVEVAETINKFDKMDLYKSIFLSDSENEEETANEDNKPNDGAKSNDNTTSMFDSINDFVDVPKNVERNTSPPRGIFANIDFDEINSWKRNAEKKTDEKVEETNNTDDKSIEADMYGPKIPDNLKKRLEETERDRITEKPTFRSKSEREAIEISSSSSDSWVEAREVKSKKKKKKNKKQKKAKKSKHKKKDR